MKSQPPSAITRSRTHNYFLALGSGYVLQFATILIGFWLTPFSLRFLDREQFAIFTLVNDLLVWLNLLDLGITAGLRLQAAQLAGSPDQDRLNRLASTAFFAQNIVVAAVLVVGVALSFAFPHLFTMSVQLQRDATWVMLLLLVGSALSLGTQTFSALLVANQQVHLDNAVALLNLVIRTVLTVVLLKLGWGLYSLAIANIVAKVTTSALAVVRTFHLLPGLQLRRDLASWQVLRGTGTLGLWLTLGSLSGIMMSTLDRIVVAKVISVEAVTTLTLTGRLYALAGGLLANLTNNARPMLGQLIGQKKMEDAARVYHHLFVLSTGLAIVGAASLWAGNGAFVTRWVGAQNYGGWTLDLTLALNLLARSWALPNRAALSAGLFKVPQHTISAVTEAVLTLVLSIGLGSLFGIAGIASAIWLATLLVPCWYLPHLTAEMFRHKFSQLLREDFRPLVVSAILIVPIAFGARKVTDLVGGGFFGAGLAVLATSSIGLALLWFLSLDRVLKDRILLHFGNLRTSALARYLNASAHVELN